MFMQRLSFLQVFSHIPFVILGFLSIFASKISIRNNFIMKTIKTLLILLAIPLLACTQNNSGSIKVEPFTEYPQEIDGGSCEFYLYKDDMSNDRYIMVNDFAQQTYLKINGKMELLLLKKDSEKEMEYSNDSYSVTIEISSQKDTGDESYTLKGKISVKNMKGETVSFPFIGQCGC